MNNHDDHDDDDQDISPLLKGLFEMFSKSFAAGSVFAEADEAHRQWHRDMIDHWEEGREFLSKKYGVQAATDLIELQRMSYRFCTNGQSGMSRLLSVVIDLMVASDGDPAILGSVVKRLENVLRVIVESRSKAKPKKSKPKPQPKPKPEPRPKGQTRAEAEAEAAKRRFEAESN